MKMEFPDKADVLNFTLDIVPDEGESVRAWRGARRGA